MASLIVILMALSQNIRAQSIFEGLTGRAERLCEPSQTLATCFHVATPACLNRVRGASETCVREQKIRHVGKTDFDPALRTQIERDFDACIMNRFAEYSRSALSKDPKCAKFAAPALKVAPPSRLISASEDPLEGQRDLVSRYKLKIVGDLRRVQELRTRVGGCAQKLTCFRAELAKFEVTSSPQIVGLMTVATAAAMPDRDVNQLADVLLAVGEKAHLAQFHLSRLEPTSDADRVAHERLVRDDEKLLKDSVARIADLLTKKLNEKRQPASGNDLRLRIEALKNRGWSYDLYR